MQTIQDTEFLSKVSTLMDEIETTKETWVVTKNGRPVAELRPYSGKPVRSPFGLHPNIEIKGDIIAPLDDVEWKATE